MEIQIYKPDDFINPTQQKLVSVIEKFNSMIWTERFNGYGDFELYIPVYDKTFLNLIADNGSLNILNFFVDIKGSDTTMIIEDVKLETDVENGDYFTITGRSLESILERRIIHQNPLITKGSLNNCIKKILQKNAYSSSTDSNRRFGGLEFEDATDSYILDTQISAQFTGDNVYETIYSICEAFNIGFEIKRKYYKTGNLSDFNKFVFKLINRTDRSTEQTDNPYVIFSNEYGNIFSSNYLTSSANIKTYAKIDGKDLAGNRRTRNIYISNYSDNRNWRLKELYVDARDIQSEDDEGEPISDADYNAMLDERGYEKLAEYLDIDSIEGEFDPNGNFKLGRDYFLGDIVQIEYPITGISRQAAIDETVLCENSEGISYIPTFVLL